MSPVISASVVRRPRKEHRCSMCMKLIEGPHLRLFGYPHTGDQPYRIRLHPQAPPDRAQRVGGLSTAPRTASRSSRMVRRSSPTPPTQQQYEP